MSEKVPRGLETNQWELRTVKSSELFCLWRQWRHRSNQLPAFRLYPSVWTMLARHRTGILVCLHACKTVGTFRQKQNRHRVHGLSEKKVIIYSWAGGITLTTPGDPLYLIGTKHQFTIQQIHCQHQHNEAPFRFHTFQFIRTALSTSLYIWRPAVSSSLHVNFYTCFPISNDTLVCRCVYTMSILISVWFNFVILTYSCVLTIGEFSSCQSAKWVNQSVQAESAKCQDGATV